MTSCEPAVRRALMALLKSGAITIPEAATLANVSRQSVWYWVRDAGWNMEARRRAYVARTFARALDADRKPSKKELRRQAEEAKEMWDWRNG
jgi:hypothetical protein